MTKEALKKNFEQLKKAAGQLLYSYNKVKDVDLKKGILTQQQLDDFENLSSRFGRLSDLVIQQAFRLIGALELDDDRLSVIDRINSAEKRGLIDSAEMFKNIRLVRNKIVHVYAEENFPELFAEILSLTPELLRSVDQIQSFSKKY